MTNKALTALFGLLLVITFAVALFQANDMLQDSSKIGTELVKVEPPCLPKPCVCPNPFQSSQYQLKLDLDGLDIFKRIGG